MMEVLWKASNRSVVVLLLFGLCNGLPINLENSGPDPHTQFLTGLVAVLLTICSVVLLAGCLCCQRKNGFKEFRDSPVVSSAAIVSTNQDHGHVNPIANSSSEFTIFTPISPPHHNNNVFLANQRIVSCSQEDYKDGDIDASSWFDGSEKDFPRTKLKYIRELGKGWFGRVVEGTAQNISEDPSDPEWTPVIVRILESSATSREKLLFLNDVAIYKCGYHPNILRILGRSLDTAPLLLLQEYCPQGDLKKYLRMCKSSQDKLVAEDMPLRWCYQLTLALKFLHEQKLTHPDLAARNCQLSDDLSLKLGDYGLSAAYYPEDYYQGSPGVPLRWCAPEIISYTSTTIQTTPITTESNVWALGVAMWEILEWGEQPYLGLTDDEVISQVLGMPKVRLTRPTYHLIYTEYMYKIMQSCWYNAESRVTVSQIELMMTDLMHVYENTKMSLDLTSDIPHEGEPISLEDFDSRWNALKPNSPTEHETNALEPNQNHQQKQDRSQKSASLNNLHGSLDNLLDTRQFDPMESWLENVASDTSDMSFVRGLSEAITDLDNAIAMQNLNSSPEFGLKSSKIASGPQFTSSESETEDENWRRKIERGAYTEKVRQKSRSVADLMVLTHIDCSESDSETLPSLDYKVNQRVRYLKSVENQKKFGSEGNLFQAQDNTFREELKKLQEERRDSLLFVPDKFSECSFSEEGGAIAPTSLSNNRLDSLENSPVKMLMEKLNSPSEMVPPQQVYNVFNVRVRHMKVGSTVCDKVGETDAINNDIAANVICDRLESKVLEQNVLVPDSPANQNSPLNINQNVGRESPNHIKTIFSPIEDVRIKSVDGENVTFSKIRDLNIETYPSLNDVKSTNLGFDKIDKEPITTKETNFEVKIEILNEQNSPSTIQKNYDHLSNEISPKEIFVTSKENSKNIKLKVPKLSEIIQRNAIDYKVHHHHSVGGGNDKSSVISKSEENEKLVHQEIVDKDSGLNTPENSASLEKLYDDNEEILDIGSFDSDRSNDTNNKGVLLTDISNEDDASVKEKREIDSKEEISEMIDFCIKKETRLICDLFLTHERSACFVDVDEKFDKDNIGDVAKKYSFLNYDYRKDMQNFIEAEVYHSSNLIEHSLFLNELENDFNTKSSESVYNKENREVLNLSSLNLPNVSIIDTNPLVKDIVNINDGGNFNILGGIPDKVVIPSLPREDQNKICITTPSKDEVHLNNTDVIKIISDINLTQFENELRGNLVLETKIATEDLNDKVNLEDGLREIVTIDCNNRLNNLSDLSTSANSDKFGDDQVKDQISLDNNLMPNLSDKEHISIMFESEFAKNNYEEEDVNENREEICSVQVESNEGDDDMLPDTLIRQRTTLFLTNEVINYDDSHRDKNEVCKEIQNVESSRFSQVNATTIEQTLMFLNNEIENYETSNFYQEKLDGEFNEIENKIDNKIINENLLESSNFPSNGIGNLVEIESKARFDQNVLDKSSNEDFYQENLDDELKNLPEGSSFPDNGIGNLAEIEPEARFDQKVLDESCNENFYQENLDDELNKIENKFENEGINENLPEGSSFRDNGIANLVEIEPKAQFDQNILAESPKENIYQENLDDELSKIENKFENEGIHKNLTEESNFPDNAIGNLVEIETKARFDQNILAESPKENFCQENLDDELNKIENKFDNEGIHENLPEGSNFPDNGIGNLVEIQSKTRFDQNILNESRNENLYERKINVAPNLNEKLIEIENKIENKMITEISEETLNFPNNTLNLSNNLETITTNGSDGILQETSTFLKNEIENYENSIEAATNLTGNDTTTEFHRNILEEGVDKAETLPNRQEELNRTNFNRDLINVDNQIPNEEMANYLVLKDGINEDENILDLSNSIELVENHAKISQINEIMQETAENLVNIESKNKFDRNNLEEDVDQGEILGQNDQINKIKETLTFLQNELENYCDEGMTKLDCNSSTEDSNRNDLTIETSMFLKNEIDNYSGNERRVDFDLSDTQEKISLNSLTHISTFTSTPFANRRPNDSAVILGASDDYSIDYYSGLKTSVDPEEGTDLQFSSNFVRPSNTNDLYSLETWDNFLGRSFDEQENATVDFSDFSQEPHSLLFLECADESGRQTNEVKMTKVLDETYEVGNATVPNETFIKEIGEENPNATFDVSVDKAKDQVETDPWKNAKNNGTASGWFLHPQASSKDSPIKESAPPATTSTEESYVGFSMDDEIMAAIRNELLTKLPHAQRASSEHQIEESCEEMDSAERNEVFLRYNVYNTPLSPIPEESYDSEMGSGRITPKRINDTSEDEGDSSDWSVQEDNNSSNARTEEIISPRIPESPARCRTDPYRHTPSQDSCCSNDTLFNVEELNTAPNDRLLSEPLFNLTHRLDNPLDSTEDETGDSKYVDCSPERRLTPDQIEPERNGKLPEVPIIRTEHGYILDFLDNERYGEMNTSLDAGEEVSSASDIYLTVSENTFSFGQNVAPLNSPEDRPWKELQASFRDCDEDRYEETNSQKRDINNTLDTTILVKQDIEPLITTTTQTQNPTDLKDSSSFVPRLDEGEEDCQISDEDIDQVLREDMESERLSNQKLEENILDDVKMLEESPISPIDDKTCNSDVYYVNLDKTEGEASVDTFDSITPEEEETYIDIENDESAVEDGDQFYVNLEVRADTHNADLKNDGGTKSQGEISANPVDLKDDNIYANLTKTESGESFNTEDSSYSESTNGIPVMGYENLRRNNTRDEDAIYSKIDSVDDDDSRFDRFGDLFGPLTDIRFSGPGSSSQTMATSFSESCDLGDDQDWDSGSDTRSSSSGEFIWKEGEHEASVKALRAPPQTENINYVTPMENIREEEPPADSHVDNSGGSSSGSEGEDECPEFVPSAWDKYATPTKSALRSPEKTLERSREEKDGDRRTPKEKKTKGVSFKKQKYHCVYEYPREPESPVLQSYDLWKPAPDYVTLSDWDLDTDAYLPVSSLTNTEIHDTQPLRENSPKNLYHLNAFTDINVDPSVLEEDFFVSSSSKPFDMLTGLTSQFFPGRQFTGDSWTDVTNNTPDSGVEDVTTPATFVDETDGSYGNKNRSDSPLTGVQSLKVLAANAAERSGTRRELGGLRHTRNKLKLDLPPSPSAFTSNRTFSIDTAAEEIVTRQVPTFTTFGKSRFLVQHVDTPPDSGPADKNVSFEALPHKKPESQTLLVDTSRWQEEKRDRQKIESVRGEASLLDSADEDSGIESCTLDRKRFNI